MPAPISMDLRRRIVRAVGGGSSVREAARRFAVAPSTAIKLMQRVRATGSPLPGRSGHRPPATRPARGHAPSAPRRDARLTLAELQTELARRTGIVAGLTTLHKTLYRLGLRHKKSR